MPHYGMGIYIFLLKPPNRDTAGCKLLGASLSLYLSESLRISNGSVFPLNPTYAPKHWAYRIKVCPQLLCSPSTVVHAALQIIS